MTGANNPPLIHSLQLSSENKILMRQQAIQKLRKVMVKIAEAYSLDLPEDELRPIIDRLYEEKRRLDLILKTSKE